MIQAQYRGRLGRREAVTELSLQLIKGAHSKLLKMSLVNRFGVRKVFWFKAKAELLTKPSLIFGLPEARLDPCHVHGPGQTQSQGCA